MASKKEKVKKEVKSFVSKYVLVKPHISEKATELSEKGFYVFKVLKKSNKKEIKHEVENKYKVSVDSVRVINVPRKKTRLGRTEGVKSGYKKAIVKLKKGETIELMIT